MGKTKSSVPAERIEQAILFIRGKKVMLDVDLAALYEVETGVLNRVVKRNVDRFPEDFMFQLTLEETERLRCQNGISKPVSRLAFSSKSAVLHTAQGKNARRNDIVIVFILYIGFVIWFGIIFADRYEPRADLMPF